MKLAFYYPWYGNKIHSQNYIHWKNVDKSNKVIENSPNYPILGAYDSGDPFVIHHHCKWAKSCGIHGFIVSWWGIDTFEDQNILSLLNIGKKYDIKICIYYEKIKGPRKLYTQNLDHDIVYIQNKYTKHPNYLYYKNKPMLFVYRRPIQQIGVHIWDKYKKILFMIGDKITIPRAKSFSGIHHYNPISYIASCTGINDIKHTLYTFMKKTIDIQNKYHLPKIVSVAKGYDDRSERENGLVIDSRNGQLYRIMLDTAMQFEPDIVLITSWNEWHEKTEIEPSIEDGNLYLDITSEYLV